MQRRLGEDGRGGVHPGAAQAGCLRGHLHRAGHLLHRAEGVVAALSPRKGRGSLSS